ncbi:MAG: hypothetical protein AAFV33_05895 [Chloroflexota bacterium]
MDARGDVRRWLVVDYSSVAMVDKRSGIAKPADEPHDGATLLLLAGIHFLLKLGIKPFEVFDVNFRIVDLNKLIAQDAQTAWVAIVELFIELIVPDYSCLSAR